MIDFHLVHLHSSVKILHLWDVCVIGETGGSVQISDWNVVRVVVVQNIVQTLERGALNNLKRKGVLR